MADLRTEVTEIVTGLAMIGFPDLDYALSVRPAVVKNVRPEHFDRLSEARGAGRFAPEFETAWSNGAAFARDALRGRPPTRLEWKGPHKPPGYEQVPADLRIDHVYLVSCKYGSNILHNASPAHLFDRRLADRRRDGTTDWFAEVAPEAYQELYDACRREIGACELPASVAALDQAQRERLKRAFARRWPDAVEPVYREFSNAVSHASAQRWLASLERPAAREEMVWRLLRLQAAPYFVLGAAGDGSAVRYRVGTPWDFRDQFRLARFDSWADPAGQPLVRWRADVFDRVGDCERVIAGHVEIRWSHGRFAGAPEAKVHLDTPAPDVAGYFPL